MQGEPQAHNRQQGDMVLPPGIQAFIQSETNGHVKTHVGPSVPSMQATDRPVKYDPRTRTFHEVSQQDAMMACIIAGEGDYVILNNPADDDSHPQVATGNPSPKDGLRMGSRYVIPGPCQFALFPEQSAQVLHGHNLRSNQYLLARVYNEEAARENWEKGIQKKANPPPNEGDDPTDAKEQSDVEVKERREALSVTQLKAEDLRLGMRIIIRGNEVSFYIPPTGIEVIPQDAGREERERYVREAVTLERLEYCVLIEEGGERRYPKGPSVVFPSPTERFHQKSGKSKFKAIEVTNRSGLHIKVIAAYSEDNVDYNPGDELFITGSADDNGGREGLKTIHQAIYYPRPEHSIVRYGDQEQHFATAIPVGEGRYLMNRDSGVIDTKKGPAMLLPDPRSHVIVRRILDDKEVLLWYPGNSDALDYNRTLRIAAVEVGESLSAMDEDDDADRASYANRGDVVSESGLLGRSKAGRSSSMSASSAHRPSSPDSGLESLAVVGTAGDTFSRKTSYTQPRTVTLDTKFDGVPRIGIWTGYAIMVVDRQTNRKVHMGPDSVLLNYDETLEILSISTGKPKGTDRLKRTVYLRVLNNKVSDIIGKNDTLETKDHARVEIQISLGVDFEGNDREKWFQVENYVKLLCDHVRSVLKGVVQKMTIEELYSNHVAVVRDAILGVAVAVDGVKGDRPGMRFAENGMVVRDVEVLDFTIRDPKISQLLSNAQYEAVKGNVEIEEAEKKLAITLREEEVNQASEKARGATALHALELKSELNDKTLEVNQAQIEAEKVQAIARKDANTAREEAGAIAHEFELSRIKAIDQQKIEIDTAKQSLELAHLEADVAAAVKRFDAAAPGLSEALIALNRDDVLMKIAQATSVQTMIGGDNIVDAVHKIFKGTPLADLASRIALFQTRSNDTDS